MEDELDNEFYEVAHLFLNKSLTAYVENEDDSVFWYHIFQKYAPNLNIEFEYNFKGDLSRGKEGLLKNIDKLGKSFVLCIDSDMDFLLDKNYFTHKNATYIFQTYVYAKENFQCQNLNYLCIDATNNTTINFDFNVFLENLSNIFYPLLLIWVYFKKNKLPQPKQLQNKNFKNTINIPDTTTLNLEQNGEKIIEDIQQKIEQIIQKIKKQYPNISTTALEKKLLQKIPDLERIAYLWIQGHNLKDNLFFLIKAIVHQQVQNIKKDLESNKVKASKKEQDILKEKVANINNLTSFYNKELFENRIKTLLEINYQKCLMYENCKWMQKIKQDIQEFIHEK